MIFKFKTKLSYFSLYKFNRKKLLFTLNMAYIFQHHFNLMRKKKLIFPDLQLGNTKPSNFL